MTRVTDKTTRFASAPPFAGLFSGTAPTGRLRYLPPCEHKHVEFENRTLIAKVGLNS